MTLIQMPQADASVLGRREQILSGLSRALRSNAIIGDEASLRAFETDALTACRAIPLAVALPRTTAEVSRILRFCNDNKVKVVARGAGTSLSGGAVPLGDAVVIGLSRMNRILDVNFLDRTATVEAGITNLGISNAVAHGRFFYAPDPSSQLACTIGGNIATNAGGAHCLKYGVTANNVLKVKMVLMDGEIVELGGNYLDGQGYDLLGLAIGSEGQFGIVTEATVRILHQPEGARPMLIGFPSVEISERVRRCDHRRWADSGGDRIHGQTRHPAVRKFREGRISARMPRPCSSSKSRGRRAKSPTRSPKSGRLQAASNRQRRAWPKASRRRLRSGRAAKRPSAPSDASRIIICMDGVIPLGKLAEVLKQVEAAGQKHKLKIANIFHAGDGNLHPIILYNANDEHEKVAAEGCGAEILKLCVDAGGCLTGEHGVGIEKRELMRYQYSEADLIQQARVKAAFDPQWLLNFGKVFPLDLQTRFMAEGRESHG